MPKPLSSALEVETTDDNRVVIKEEYDDCNIQIDGRSIPLKLLPITLGEFDVIIGMDWLAKNQAKIVCDKKIIQIESPDGGTMVIYGDRSNRKSSIISLAKARRCVRKGCQSYLAYVIDAKKEKKSMDDIAVVREFPEVFPDDLTSLPPERQVEFQIHLVPGAAPIARTPYRLAPSEMKELMSQLQELLDKGFIRPSPSP